MSKIDGIQTHTFEQQPTTETLLWTLQTLLKQLGLSRSNIYQHLQLGEFPQPIKVGRSSRWLPAEIKAWVDMKANQRTPREME